MILALQGLTFAGLGMQGGGIEEPQCLEGDPEEAGVNTGLGKACPTT